MLKALFATTALALAMPAFAQDTQTQPVPPSEESNLPTAPETTQQTAPATTAPAPTEAPAEPDATTAAETAPPAEPTTEPADAAQPQPGTTPAPQETTTANSADAVSRVVESDFARYDGNGDGQLTKEEFGTWMTALRSNSAAADTGDTTQWTEQAFAQADTDRNAAISRGEVTQFLQG